MINFPKIKISVQLTFLKLKTLKVESPLFIKKDYGKVIEPKTYTLEKLGFYFLRNSLSVSRQEKEEKILFHFKWVIF